MGDLAGAGGIGIDGDGINHLRHTQVIQVSYLINF